MNSFKKKSKKLKRKRDKKRKKDRKRKRSSSFDSSSSDSSSSSSSSSSSDEKYKKRKHKKDRKRKKLEKIDNKTKIDKSTGESSKPTVQETAEDADFSIPLDLMNTNHNAPETKEAYEKRQSIVRRVVDEETGRTRLVKGDGEILEEIVSRDRHREINKNATQSDGKNYSNKMLGWAKNNSK